MQRSNSSTVGSNSIVHKKSYWQNLGEQYDTFKQYGRYETGH